MGVSPWGELSSKVETTKVTGLGFLNAQNSNLGGLKFSWCFDCIHSFVAFRRKIVLYFETKSWRNTPGEHVEMMGIGFANDDRTSSGLNWALNIEEP